MSTIHHARPDLILLDVVMPGKTGYHYSALHSESNLAIPILEICARLASYASRLCRYLGLAYDDIVALKRGGYLHDLGKVRIPDEILKKGSALTREEWEIMKQHPIIGEEICEPLKSFGRGLPIIRHHHEHWNGSGYPDRLAGKQTPLLVRVLQVVDLYDALRTARPLQTYTDRRRGKTYHATRSPARPMG